MLEEVLLCPNCYLTSLKVSRDEISCGSCGFRSLKNKISLFFDFTATAPRQSRSLLEHQAQDYYTNYAYREFCIRQNAARLKEIVSRLQPESILDIGCGTGRYGIVLSNFYSQYIGLDPSEVPEGIALDVDLPRNALLIRNDPDKPWPILDSTVDLVSFIASYDHIPNPSETIEQAWSKLKPGGHLLINMTNYGYWLKSLANFFFKNNILKHEHDHFCVHSCQSLVKEISAFIPDIELVVTDADDRHIPNLPKKLKFLYFHPVWIRAVNAIFRFVVTKIFRLKNRGAVMILVFQKSAASMNTGLHARESKLGNLR